MTKINEPKNLIEAVQFFADEAVCVDFIASLKWDEGKPCCPKCGSLNVIGLKTRPVYKCREKGCEKQFSVKVGTVFEGCNVPLSKFMVCFWLLANAKNGISSHEVGRSLSVSQKTAWHMLHRVRKAMEENLEIQLSGAVEIDECVIGGKAIHMHEARKKSLTKRKAVTGNKTLVLGMVERGGRVRAKVVENGRRHNLMPEILESISPDAKVYTDKLRSYDRLDEHFAEHESVDHFHKEFVRGEAHTNTLENYWCLLKRSVKGTYTKVASFHTDRYLSEQSFRFNYRKTTDYGRFKLLCSMIFGKRLKFNELIGAE
jgi:transposase-like protein